MSRKLQKCKQQGRPGGAVIKTNITWPETVAACHAPLNTPCFWSVTSLAAETQISCLVWVHIKIVI